MDTAAQDLLIIVSIILSIFLLVLIVTLIYFLQVLKSLRRITERAETVADSVESAAAAFERSATPIGVIRLIGHIIDQTTKVRKRKG